MILKTPRWLPVAFVLCAAAGWLLARQNGPSAPPAGAVAFVNMDRCIQDYAPFRAQVDQLRKDYEGVLQSFQEREKKLKELESELQVMQQGTEQYVQKAYEYDTQKVLYDRDNKFHSDRLNAQRVDLFLRAFPKIQAAASAVGARQGYATVVVQPADLDERDLQSDPVGAFNKLQQRPVLWTNPSYDVTDQVLEELRKSS